MWQRGALAGATPAEGFFVRCDEDTTPAGRARPRRARRRSRRGAGQALRVHRPAGRPHRQPVRDRGDRSDVSGGLVIATGAVAQRHDPPLNHNFVISLVDSSSSLVLGRGGRTWADSPWPAASRECTGLEMSMQPEEYKEGGRNGAVLKFPNRVTWSNLTLKKGAGLGIAALGLALRLRHGSGRRRDGVIVLLDAAHAPSVGLVLPPRPAGEVHRPDPQRHPEHRRDRGDRDRPRRHSSRAWLRPGRERRRPRRPGWARPWTSKSARSPARCAPLTATRCSRRRLLERIVRRRRRGCSGRRTSASAERGAERKITGGVSAERDAEE